MKILFLSRWFPYPPTNGSKIRILNILRQLASAHDVTLLTFGESTDQIDAVTVRALEAYCSRIRVVPYRRFQPASRKARLGFFSPQPRSLVDTYSPEMMAAVREACDRRHYDLIIASQSAMIPYALDGSGIPALLEELEVSTFLDATRCGGSVSQRLRALLTWLKLSAYVRRVLPRFAACTVVSELEQEHLRAIAPTYRAVSVLPNAVDLRDYADPFGPARPRSLIHAGALSYSANYDAVRLFLTEMYPAVARAVPQLTFRVTGATAGVDLAALPHHPGVEFTGHVPDVRPLVAESWASVVPLRVGGGTRLKILEAMALGTPVVATSKGAEGLAVSHGDNILLADSAQEFADTVVALLQSPRLRAHLADGGRRLVETRYDWRVVGQELLLLLEQVAARSAA